MLMYEFIIHYWYVGLAILVFGGLALYYYFKTEKGKLTVLYGIDESTYYRSPVCKKCDIAFCQHFCILQSSGVDILQTMDILTDTIGNAAISHELNGIRERLAAGHGIAGPLSSAKYFTPMLINMVAIGEESGNLEELLQDVATHYDTEVEYAMKKMSEAIGPILTIGLAAVVGFFALAIFLPMWDLTQMAK